MPDSILLIDPNPADARRIEEIFEELATPNTVHRVHTGNDALDFINQRGQYSEAPSPQLVILNPHLPQMDGYELLDDLKNEPMFKLTPVLILSDSKAEEEILQSYSLHANAHIQKSDDPEEFNAIIEGIEAFWLSTARLPPER